MGAQATCQTDRRMTRERPDLATVRPGCERTGTTAVRFSATDIHIAVLDDGVRDPDGLRALMAMRDRPI